MSFSPVMKQVVQGIIWAGVLLLLAWRVPAIAQGISANGAALQAASLCAELGANNAIARPADAKRASHLSWFEMAEARCAGDAARTLEALRAVLASSDARISVVRQIMPADVQLAQLAVRKYPDNAVPHFWLADALSAKQDIQGATRAYEEGLALDGTDANAWEAVGKLYEDSGDLYAAVSAYDRACFHMDSGKNGCGTAARLHIELEEFSEALARYMNMVEQIPYLEPGTKLRPVDSFLKLGRVEEAAEYLRFLVDHGVPEARSRLAQLEKR